MRAWFLVFVSLCSFLFADDEAFKEEKIETHVHAGAVPSLVNLTALPSAVVNGCVNVITGDLCDSEQDDLVAGPDPYVLGHNYSSSSLDEGNLGDGWNFLHHHFVEVCQPNRINYVQKGDDGEAESVLFPINALEPALFDEAFDVGIDLEGSNAPLEEDDDEDSALTSDFPLGVQKGREERGRDRRAKPNARQRNHAPPPRYEPLYLSLYEPSGGRLLFKAELDRHHKERSLRHFKLVTKKSGFTNVLGGEISGQANIKNIRLSWDKRHDRFTVIFGDGMQRVYERQSTLKEMRHNDRKRAKFYRDYQLHKEVLPSGNSRIYHYNDKHEISNITTYNKDYSQRLNWVDFEQKSSGAFAKHPSLHVKTSDSLEHVYYFKRLKGSFMHGTYSVSGIKRQGYPYIDYTYSETSSRHKRRVIKKEHKGHGYIKTKYYRWEDNQLGSRHIVPHDKKESKFLHNRVRLQTAPVGPNGQEEITHRYFYYKGPNGGGHTTVRQPYGLITRYYWNKHRRLTLIKTSVKDETLKSERFYWGKEGSRDEGRLMAYVLFAEDDAPKLAHLYEYDAHGNVTKESLCGSFTGKVKKMRLDKKTGKPEQKSCDVISTRYTYSDDGFNLKTSECDTAGNYTYYEYVKGTNLLKAKLVCDKKEIKRREFFSYDKNAIMVEHIVDDGSSKEKERLEHVTERHITRIKPRTKWPHFGEPETIEEGYLDLQTKKEKVLTQTIHHFNDKGFIKKKTLIADGESSFEYDHDDIGRVLSCKDPLGQVTFYTYDAAGLIASKRGPRHDVAWYYTYDKLGRLIEEREEQAYGLILKTSYEYDLLGRKISETNPQGGVTRYKYDALNRLSEINYPVTYDHEGKEVSPTKYYTYENLGTKVIETNENNHQTITTYNALGKITSQKFADGTERKQTYDLMGNVVKEIAPNKTETKKTYDAFNRLVHSCVEKDGIVFSEKQVRYNSFHPVEERGPCNQIISYRYDDVGRKIAASQEERLTTYDYDAKGRLLHEKTYLNKESWIGKRYEYDKLDRVVYEKSHDSAHRVCAYKIMGYDAEGNCSHIIQNIDGKSSESTVSYRPHALVEVAKDAEGNETHYRYFHYFINSFGQTVLRRDTVDARGGTTEERFDARNNLDEVLRFDPFGNVIAKKKLFYDASNNLLRIHESVIVNGREEKQVVTLLSYGPHRRLDAITEAAGTPEEKTTRYSYDKYGQKQSTLYADGTKLSCSYDGKGRVLRYHADDATIDYTYSYDKADRLTNVTNNLTNRCTERTYNTFGEVIQEKLETDLTLQYAYDMAGRIIALTLPDQSKVEYDYAPTFLKSIRRIKGEELYRYTITKRDQAGHIKACQLPKNGGELTFNYDRLHRCIKIDHDKFHQEVGGFDATGNLLQLKTEDALGIYQRSFAYDHLSQLTEEKGPVSHSYRYDSLFNRLAKDDSPYKVNSLHSVLSDSKSHYRYDLRGNRLAKDNISYRYDALDRLIEVRFSDKTISYTYDAFNRRLTKSDGTKYLYALDNEIGAVNAEGKLTELRMLGEGLGAEIGAAVAIELQDQLFIPLHDRQGNVVTLLDEQGQVADTYRYDAFGNETEGTHATTNPWRFSSKRLDEETGLIYFGRRYYDPCLGKWLTQDPLGLKAGPNLYAYVINNPLTHFDCYGLLEEQQAADAGHERNFVERVWDGVKSLGKGIRNTVYAGIEKMAHHLPHIGNLNNKIVDTMREWRGVSPLDRRPSGVYLVKEGKETSTGCRAVGVWNGVACGWKELKKNIEGLIEAFKGDHPSMYAMYSESKGFCMDMFRAIGNIMGVSTSNIPALSEGIKGLNQMCIEAGSGKYWVSNPHSLGGITFWRACRDIDPGQRHLERISVESIASTKVFWEKQGFRSAENYGGISDFVTHISDPIGFIWKGIIQGKYNFVGHPFQPPCFSHGYLSSEYKNVLDDIVKDHL